MTMKTTLDNGLLSSPGSFARPHDLTSHTVLVPMLNLGVASDMIELAAILAAGPRAERMRNGRASATSATSTSGADPRVVVVGVVEVPPDQPLTTGLIMARSYRALLDFLPSAVEVAGKQVRIDRTVKASRDITSAVYPA